MVMPASPDNRQAVISIKVERRNRVEKVFSLLLSGQRRQTVINPNNSENRDPKTGLGL